MRIILDQSFQNDTILCGAYVNVMLHGWCTVQVTWMVYSTDHMDGVQYRTHGRCTVQITWMVHSTDHMDGVQYRSQ